MSDPLSHVASWIAPTAANLSITSDVDDPLVALIRERDRLFRLAEDTKARGDEIEAGLPDDVRFKKVQVSSLGLAGDEDFKTEEELRRFFSILDVVAHVTAARQKLDKDAKDQITARVDRFEAKVLDEFKVGMERIHELREASGCEALYREAEALEEQADELHDQICDTPAGSFDALLWQIEHARLYFEYEGMLDTIFAGVKRLAGPSCSLGLAELMKAERTPRRAEGEPEERP
jgi:hypothetical protein